MIKILKLRRNYDQNLKFKQKFFRIELEKRVLCRGEKGVWLNHFKRIE